MRLAYISQWYSPEPTDIPVSIARAMAAENLRVEVLTGVPNYPHGVVPKGYRAWSIRTEEIDGISVRRAPLYPSHNSSAAKRILNYLSFALSASVTGQGVIRRADVSLVYSSPATAALPAMLGRALWRTPYVLIVQDLWPDSVFASGFLRGGTSRTAYAIVERFVRASYALAQHVVVISPGMRNLLVERGVPSQKISLIYNWLPDSETTEDFGGEQDDLLEILGLPPSTTTFIYAGNHGRAQALDVIVRAFLTDASGNSHLVMLGDGVTKKNLQDLAQGSARIHFIPSVARSRAARLTRQADFHVVSLADQPLFAVTMPSKVQSGLAAGVPMLVVCAGDAAELVEGSGAGVAAAPGDAVAVAAAIRNLSTLDDVSRREMGRRGRELYASQMSRTIGSARMREVLRSAARHDERDEQ